MRLIRSAWLEEAGEIELNRDIYSDNLREDLIDNDEISIEEEAFMVGWNEAA